MAKPIDALSLTQLVKRLEVGESFSKSERVKVGSKTAKDMKGVLQAIRTTCNQIVSRVRKDTGSNFEVQSGLFLTDDLIYIIATVAITRNEDDYGDTDFI